MKQLLGTVALSTMLFMPMAYAEQDVKLDKNSEVQKCQCDCNCNKGKKKHQHSYKVGDLTLSHASIRPISAPQMPTAAYMTIENTGATDDRLIAIQSDISDTIELHDTKINENGVMSMNKLEKGIDLPAQKTIELKPRNLHIMLMNVTEILEKGTHIPLKLIFEKAGARMVSFKVKNPNASQCKH